MNKKRKAIIEQNEISELVTFSLGGYEQKVLIEGKSKNLPVVITLHGGPGTPIPFSVGCREKDFCTWRLRAPHLYQRIPP